MTDSKTLVAAREALGALGAIVDEVVADDGSSDGDVARAYLRAHIRDALVHVMGVLSELDIELGAPCWLCGGGGIVEPPPTYRWSRTAPCPLCKSGSWKGSQESLSVPRPTDAAPDPHMEAAELVRSRIAPDIDREIIEGVERLVGAQDDMTARVLAGLQLPSKLVQRQPSQESLPNFVDEPERVDAVPPYGPIWCPMPGVRVCTNHTPRVDVLVVRHVSTLGYGAAAPWHYTAIVTCVPEYGPRSDDRVRHVALENLRPYRTDP